MSTFRHVGTGRVVAPREGSALARLVSDSDQWKPEGAPQDVTDGASEGDRPKPKGRRQTGKS